MIIAWLRAQARAARRAAVRLALQPWVSLFSALALAILVALSALLLRFIDLATALAQSPLATPQIFVSLKVGAARSSALALQKKWQAHEDVERVTIVPREETLAHYRRLPGYGEALAVLADNPFPDAVVVYPRLSQEAVLDRLSEALRTEREVERVDLDRGWARKLVLLAESGQRLAGLLAILFGAALVALVATLTRLSLLPRREEMGLMRLLGATEAQMRRPLLWQGAFLGLLGGVFGSLIAIAAEQALWPPVIDLVRLFGAAPTSWPWPLEVAGIVSFALVLGWLGAAVSSWRLAD